MSLLALSEWVKRNKLSAIGQFRPVVSPPSTRRSANGKGPRVVPGQEPMVAKLLHSRLCGASGLQFEADPFDTLRKKYAGGVS